MILWSINVYSRAGDARMLARQVKDHFGPEAFVLVVCSHEHLREEEFHTEHVDCFVRIPNTGHHNGVRDALNETATFLGLSSRAFTSVVCSHADNLWSSLEPVSLALSRLYTPCLTEVVEDTYDAAVLTGGPRGAMNSENPDWFGYFMDWIAFTPPCLLSITPIRRQCDGERWVECVVADVVRESGAVVFDVPCENVDRLGTNVFVNIMGNPNWWMSADHDVDRKMMRLPDEQAQRLREARE